MTGKRMRTYSAREGRRSPRMVGRKIVTNQGRRSTRNIDFDNVPTSEELRNLKREKQDLAQEKVLLKAKISRLIDITKHPYRYSPRQNTGQNSLEKEQKRLEQLSAYKRAEIASLKCSDLAAIVNELQEECLMLHMELIRVRQEKSKTDREFRQITRQLQEAEIQFNPDLERKQEKIIKELNNQIAEQTMRNKRIQAKLTERENRIYGNKQDEAALIVQRTIEDLEQKIRNEQDEIDRIDNEMRQLEEEKSQEISDLQRELDSI